MKRVSLRIRRDPREREPEVRLGDLLLGESLPGDRGVPALLGGILASLVAPKARFLAGAVGAGLTFSAVSNTCAMAAVLGKLPYNRGAGCDIDAVLREMQSTEPTR